MAEVDKSKERQRSGGAGSCTSTAGKAGHSAGQLGLRERGLALAFGLCTHVCFLAAVATMTCALYGGLQLGLGRLRGPSAWVANSLLALQFPLLHSSLLTARGRSFLARLAPAKIARDLSPTTYAWSASAQLLLTFLLWSPTGHLLYQPQGLLRGFWSLIFALSGLFLGKALWDGNLGLQTGWIGWSNVVRSRRPKFPALPTQGLFALTRQPIYLGFALLLVSGPVWTADHVLLALIWGSYCLLGPLHKERRFSARYGAAFRAYQLATPYMLPRLLRRSRSSPQLEG